MISRSVQGKADERIDGYMSIGQNISVVLTPVTLDANNECIAYNNSINNSGLQNYTLGLNNGSADSEPDIFSYSVGGYSGKFYIEVDITNDGVINGKVITIPKQDVKIDSEANDGIEITKPFNAQVDQYTTGWYLSFDKTLTAQSDSKNSFSLVNLNLEKIKQYMKTVIYVFSLIKYLYEILS